MIDGRSWREVTGLTLGSRASTRCWCWGPCCSCGSTGRGRRSCRARSRSCECCGVCRPVGFVLEIARQQSIQRLGASAARSFPPPAIHSFIHVVLFYTPGSSVIARPPCSTIALESTSSAHAPARHGSIHVPGFCVSSRSYWCSPNRVTPCSLLFWLNIFERRGKIFSGVEGEWKVGTHLVLHHAHTSTRTACDPTLFRVVSAGCS